MRRPATVAALELAAAGALAAGFSWALMVPRIPASFDLYVPRHPFPGPFRLGSWLLARPWGQTASSLSCAGLIALGLAFFAASLRAGGRKALAALAKRGPKALAGRLAAAAAVLVAVCGLARLAGELVVDVLENAWFFPQSADWREPLALWTGLAVAILAGVRCAGAFWRWVIGPRLELAACRAWAAPGAALLGLWLAVGAAASSLWGEGKPSLAAAAGLAAGNPRRRAIVVFDEEDGRPAARIRAVTLGAGSLDFDAVNLEAAERFARSKRSVWRRAALRYLYDGATVEMDAARLRRALALGHELGDALGSALLLENLSNAAASDANRRLLEELCDERRWRVGPRAAAALASAWARFGDGERATAWLARASAGAGAPAPGLLSSLAQPEATRLGTIEGAAFPWKGVRVALYARADGAEPRGGLLAPAALVESAELPPSGRFRFRGLRVGRYFLAESFDAAPASIPDGVDVQNQPGLLELSRERGRVDLGAIRLRPVSAASGTRRSGR